MEIRIQPTEKQMRSFTHFFLQNRRGEVVDCMSARLLCKQMFGIDIDHHEWAYTLDWMANSTREAEVVPSSKEFTQYIIR